MSAVPETMEYLDASGGSPFQRWFSNLPTPAANRVSIAVARLRAGNISALKAVGQGVHEVRVDFGPGYRIYIGLRGTQVVILLGGSAKARQSAAIADAQARWADFKARSR